MKLTAHQQSLFDYVASRHPRSTTAADAARFCDSGGSSCNSSWALPKLQRLTEKGLLHMLTLGYPIMHTFVLNTDNKKSFKALLKHGGTGGMTPKEFLANMRGRK